MTFDPSKWQLVPKKLTPEMDTAHYTAHAKAKSVFADAQAVWDEMLASAPQAPVVVGMFDEGIEAARKYVAHNPYPGSMFILANAIESLKGQSAPASTGLDEETIEAAATVAAEHRDKSNNHEEYTKAQDIYLAIRALTVRSSTAPAPPIEGE